MTDHDQKAGDEHRSENNTQNASSQQQSAATKILEHIKANRLDSAMLGTRLLTIFFTIAYLIPIFGNRSSAFNKVVVANVATSAIRLQQRLPAFTLSREFLSRLLIEDSCHYLLFSVFLLCFVQPTLLMLMPISLFAVLHAASYSLKLLDVIGQNSAWAARFLISLVEFQATNILKAVAFSEIIIMPICIMHTLTGYASIMTPFVYYQFLILRYSSRRNPHTRTAFTELRMLFERFAERLPAFLANIVRTGIAFVSRLAPPNQAVPPTQ